MRTEKFCINGRTSCSISYFSTLDSTNKYLKVLADNGAPSWTVIIADGQTGGYGRYGRAFDSKGNCGLYMSVLIRNDVIFDPATLTPTAAVATAIPIERLSGSAVSIKWVNDLLINRLKVCGILTEASSQGGKLEYAIVGIGVNIGGRINGFPEELKGIAGTVFEEYTEELRNTLARDILTELEGLIFGDSDKIYSEYRKRLAYVSENVRVIKSNLEYDGVVLGLDPDFRLVVRLEDGRTERLFSGEIAIKAK